MNSDVTFRGFLVQTRLIADDTTLVGTFATNGAANMRLSSCTPASVRIPVVGGVVVWSLALPISVGSSYSCQQSNAKG